MSKLWRNTALWILLKENSTETAQWTRQLLESCMDDIETVLAKGATSPADFTLHDEDHSFRVAERMVEVVTRELLTKLSPNEIGLLLLSSYLHDIGMSPERKKVTDFHEFLLFGIPGKLANEEHEAFQSWLDEEAIEVTPPLIKGDSTVENYRLAAELITYYARHKHNDWSKAWIEENLKHQHWKGYKSWKDDLIDLCQSHHWGYEELIREIFDPKVLNSGAVIHMRFLACVLRVADVLENDPERTPEVILRHRSISPGSQIYWWKDHEMVFQIAADRTATLRARPKTAVVQRAVFQTAAAIEKELRMCGRLAAEKPFRLMPRYEDLPHVWSLPDSLFVDVHPYKDRFVYIEGAFRPDTHRLLQILGGLELYGNPMSAIRELLQNSFDAVREHIAYERLNLPTQSDPADPKWLHDLGERHQVLLRLESDPQDLGTQWLICKDDGIGMTKPIIENHLLVSGNPRRRDVLALERRCRRKHFSSERTSKFGIGVLSYFMIADEVEIITRRSQIAGDADGQSWSFTSTGVGDFGQLRRTQPGSAGTEVRLKLKPGIDLSTSQFRGTEFQSSLLQYISEQVRWCPCRLLVEGLNGEDELRLNTGWAGELEMSTTRPEIDRLLRTEATEGTLPSDLGRYRFSIGSFLLKGGTSLAYFQEQIDHESLCITRTDEKDYIIPEAGYICSYKGIIVNDRSTASRGLPPCCTLQVDWTTEDAGSVSVDRKVFIISSVAEQALSEILTLMRSKLNEMIETDSASSYSLFNQTISGVESTWQPNFAWLMASSNLPPNLWGPLKFPVVLGMDRLVFEMFGSLDFNRIFGLIAKFGEDFLESVVVNSAKIGWRGNPVTVVRALKGPRYSNNFWDIQIFPPDCMSVSRSFGSRLSLIPLWTRAPERNTSPLPACLFPPDWSKILGAVFDLPHQPHCVCLNLNNPLTKRLQNCAASGDQTEGPIKIILDLLNGRSSLSAWDALVLQNRTCIEDLLRDLAAASKGPQQVNAIYVLHLKSDLGETDVMTVLSAESAILVSDVTTISTEVGEPPPEWMLDVSPIDVDTLLLPQ